MLSFKAVISNWPHWVNTGRLTNYLRTSSGKRAYAYRYVLPAAVVPIG